MAEGWTAFRWVRLRLEGSGRAHHPNFLKLVCMCVCVFVHMHMSVCMQLALGNASLPARLFCNVPRGGLPCLSLPGCPGLNSSSSSSFPCIPVVSSVPCFSHLEPPNATCPSRVNHPPVWCPAAGSWPRLYTYP